MIPLKEKPCKGTGEAKGWGCGKLTKFRQYGLGKMCCYPDWLLNSEPGKIKMEKAITKASKPRLDFEKAEKQHKERKGLSTVLEAVKEVCHEYIRMRDKWKPCISCGTPWKKDFDAGHFYKAELFSSLKFNEFNINGQCVQCNRRKDGNVNMYEMRLPDRIGEERFEELRHLARMDKRNGDFKWDREILKETRKYYRAKINQLKKSPIHEDL